MLNDLIKKYQVVSMSDQAKKVCDNILQSISKIDIQDLSNFNRLGGADLEDIKKEVASNRKLSKIVELLDDFIRTTKPYVSAKVARKRI